MKKVETKKPVTKKEESNADIFAITPTVIKKAEKLITDNKVQADLIIDNLKSIESIQSDAELTTAETNLKTAKTFLDKFEVIRKAIKKPFDDAGKMIQLFAKPISDPLEAEIVVLKGKMQLFIETKEAEKKRLEEEAKAAMNESENQLKEGAMLVNIRKQMIARIYGGTYTKLNGEEIETSGCLNLKDCDDLIIFVNTNWPSSKFVLLNELAEENKNEVITLIESRKEQLEHYLQVAEDDPAGAVEIKNQTIKLRNSLLNKVENENEALNASLSMEIQEQSTKVEILENTKIGSTRKTVAFEVHDLSKIPMQYLTVNRDAVLMEGQSKKNMIDTHPEGIITGIRFYFDKTVIAK